jgi:hypothetical protein
VVVTNAVLHPGQIMNAIVEVLRNGAYVRPIILLAVVLSVVVLVEFSTYGPDERNSAGIDTTIYQSEAYSVYSHTVIDSIYGGKAAPAIIPDDTTIFSPVRIIPKGKTVVLNNSSWWHPVRRRKQYPILRSNHPSIDAVYNVAIDILYRCSSGEFMRNAGEEGLWQAGFRRGEGYGVWTRDVCYIGLLMGSFIEPQVAKKSIEYITTYGIDNGEDGLALPAIAVWNHFVVTGDSSIITNTYKNLKTKIDKIQFNQNRNLGFAHSGSFIDSRRQPEAGGFPLSTNILYSESYRVMALMGNILNDSSTKVSLWEQRSSSMKQSINQEYWKQSGGFYTFGPKGSESYENQHWENLGQSLAIWPMWGIADQKRRISVLEHKQVAYNRYGFADLNYISVPGDEGLHGREVWIFTEVGEIVAMARENRIQEVLELFSSVIRTAAVHKTFQEVIDWETGKAWRYPGQLWNAMGYVSMIYFGILGIEYDEHGISFRNTCVPQPLADLTIEKFKYRNAEFTIKVLGWGSIEKVQLDGKPVQSIDCKLTGNHIIELLLTNGN